MENFIERHRDRVSGVLYGFDRLIFNGQPKILSFSKGLERFLAARRLRYAEFKDFFVSVTEQLIAHIEAYCADRRRPYIYLSSPSASKHETAQAIAERDGVTEGLVCVLGCLERCNTVQIRRDRHGRPRLTFTTRQCKFLYLYLIDPVFGWMHIRVQTWIPFAVQIYVNGRTFLARQLERRKVPFRQDGNCFTAIADLDLAQQQLEHLAKWDWRQQLDGWVNDLLTPVLALLNGRTYFWTLRQSEHALDVLFKSSDELARVYPALADHAIRHFRSNDILRFLGHRRVDLFNGEANSHWRERGEGVRIRHTVRGNSIKMYDKAGSVLRVETTINNPDAIRVMRPRKSTGKMERQGLRRGICDVYRRHEAAYAANQRYLIALAVVGFDPPSSEVLDAVSRPVIRRGRRHRALHPVGPDDARLLSVLSDARFAVQGFRNRDLRNNLFPHRRRERESRRDGARITRQLALLRAHGLIRRIPRSHRYQLTLKGHAVAATALSARQAPAVPGAPHEILAGEQHSQHV